MPLTGLWFYVSAELCHLQSIHMCDMKITSLLSWCHNVRVCVQGQCAVNIKVQNHILLSRPTNTIYILIIIIIFYIYIYVEGLKNSRNCLKKLFKVFVQVWNFSPRSDSLAALNSISVEDFRQCFHHWGGGAGIAASSRRGSTSKGTKVSNLYKYFK